MNIHANARLTPLRREEMARIVMDRRGTQKEAAILYGVSVRTVAKWVKRFRQAGPVAMQDRSSKPHHSPLAIAKPVEQAIQKLRAKKRSAENWIHVHNWHRPHTTLNHQTPISKIKLNRNNLLTLHI